MVTVKRNFPANVGKGFSTQTVVIVLKIDKYKGNGKIEIASKKQNDSRYGSYSI